MSKAPETRNDLLSSARLQHLDRLCSRFQAACMIEGRPRIEDYLAEVAEAERPVLLRKLLVLEFLDRGQKAETVILEEYSRRFPMDAEVIRAAFREAVEVPSPRAGAADSAPHAPADTLPEHVPAQTANDPVRLGRFQITGKLGTGGFGVVYKAHDADLQRDVAIKIAHRDQLAAPEDAEAYLAEARTLAQLDHPGIVPIYEVGRTEDGVCYLVSKFVDGHDLQARIEQARPSFREAVDIIARVAEALHHAHQRGLVHRDIKPANILLDSKGTPVLVDFGLALRDAEVGTGPTFAGTPYYMSPEQARSEGHLVDARSDVYSLGVVLYELLTGQRPFRAEKIRDLLEQITTREPRPPRLLDDRIPKELDRICLKALAKRASERYSTAADLAEDLRHWQTGPITTPLGAAPTPNVVAHPPKVVPRGLRSFEAADADFFLELLPGARDRNGLPESVRFWKQRIEEPDPDQTFRVGLLYGPSGCGKSSLIKAGLLPRLSESVLVVYVEAASAETEARLVKGLRKRCPDLPDNLSLPETLAHLRRGRGLPAGKKVLLVIDQFEQWLHAQRHESNAELVQALRQCDGQHTQCLLLVRDDFWLAVSRFLHELEIPLVEGHNAALVDLFDLLHARKVLALFGAAYGRFPENSTDWTPEQERFLTQAVEELSQEGKVITVRLSLFVDMIKGKPWTSATLNAVGGAEGVRVAFLEEKFAASTASPEYRLHQRGCRAVLKALLPGQGTEIKGHMRSSQELLAASGYAQRPKEFDALLRILDAELRLITPIDPEGIQGEDNERLPTVADAQYFQLTHDYLVPALRQWLTRKQRETRRGRTELLLEDLTQHWRRSPGDRRFLPSWAEFLKIAFFTSRHNWSIDDRALMRSAVWFHSRRLAMATMVVVIIALSAVLVLAPLLKNPEPLERIFARGTSTETREGLLQRLPRDDPDTFTEVLNRLDKARDPEIIAPVLRWVVNGPWVQDANSSQRRELISLLRKLLQDGDLAAESRAGAFDILLEAFAIFAKVESTPQVLELIGSQLSESRDEKHRGAMRAYIQALNLPSFLENERGELLRKLIKFLNNEGPANRDLVGCSLQQLDGIEPERLCNWLMKAFETEGKEAAKLSVVVYCRRTEQRGRVDEIGQVIQQRLSEIQIKPREEIRVSYALEYRIQAIGQLQALTKVRFTKALELVVDMLKFRDQLESRELLDSLIEALAQLYDGRPERLVPVRELLASGPLPARVKAAEALGDVADVGSLNDLIQVLRSEEEGILLIQSAAIKSLRKLTSRLRDHEQSTQQIKELLQELIQPTAVQQSRPEIVGPAIDAFAEFADPESAKMFFDWLLHRRLNVTAAFAIGSIIRRYPDKASIVVRQFLKWHISHERGAGDYVLDPERALLSFARESKNTPEEERQVRLAARAVAAALAEAHEDQELEIRKAASRLLGRLFEGGLGPPLNPTAETETRKAQCRAWREWWDKGEGSKLRFTGLIFVVPAERPS